MINPEALSSEPISRLDYAREQLRNPNLTPAERAVAWSIVSSTPTSGVLDGAASFLEDIE